MLNWFGPAIPHGDTVGSKDLIPRILGILSFGEATIMAVYVPEGHLAIKLYSWGGALILE